ncbi:MAG: hypothetical protein BJ554DRAFT_7502 [Olpidium bornovanus]|uniref:Uncharacterized protein n=1 Tax=Olpidium bornovanus TaxID=278681 RepID=A0A8H8DJT7_9FUNG|nr:MAG: hypothetical protein BJ554DRAFT_7502 [Olpidium bornovanus]
MKFPSGGAWGSALFTSANPRNQTGPLSEKMPSPHLPSRMAPLTARFISETLPFASQVGSRPPWQNTVSPTTVIMSNSRR